MCKVIICEIWIGNFLTLVCECHKNYKIDIKIKSVFIRVGSKFIEKDFYQYDAYAKSIKEKYYGL